MLWLQCEAEYQPGLLRTGIGVDGSEHRDGEFIGDGDVLGGLQRHIRHREAVHVIIVCRIGHHADRGCPVQTSKTEGGCQFQITAVGALAFIVGSVIPGEIRVPLHRCHAKIVADIGLKNVVGAMGVVFEVAVAGVEAGIRPVIGHPDVETSCGIGKREVQFLGVLSVADTHIAPSRE